MGVSSGISVNSGSLDQIQLNMSADWITAPWERFGVSELVF
jgi:hypothetical protein